VVPRDELLTEVWGYKPGVRTRTIDATCSRLRPKLEDDPAHPRHLLTLYGRGVRLDGVELLRDTSDRRSFVGRGQLVREIVEQLEHRRLVTLIGPGGIGKTRTAEEVVPQLGVPAAFVSCADARSEDEVDLAVARALGLPVQARPAASLARQGSLVLVLDECELAAQSVGARVSDWLSRAPQLRVLVTSRIRLDVPREHAIVLEVLEEDEAIELFLERAGMEVSREAVRRVVGRLEGLPLALELAAWRSRLVGMEQLEALLAAPLDVLGGHGRASMAEVLDRSFAVLSPEDRHVLTAAASFEGPFDLEALSAVCGLTVPATLDRIESLVAQSLLRVPSPGRYTLFTVVRERARRELAAGAPAWRSHARWIARLADPQTLVRADRRAALDAAEADLRAAFYRMLPLEPELAGRCGVALARQLARVGSIAEVLALGPVVEPLVSGRHRVLLGLAVARAHGSLGDFPAAIRAVEAVVDLAEDAHDLVLLRVSLAMSRRQTGDVDGGRAELERARPWVASSGPARGEWLQKAGLFADDLDQGEMLLRQAAREARQHADPHLEAVTLMHLVDQAQRRGEDDETWPLAQRLHDLGRRSDLVAYVRGAALFTVARLEVQRGNLDLGEQLLEEAAQLAVRCAPEDNLPGLVRVEIARVWTQLGRGEDARRELAPLTWAVTWPSIVACQAAIALAEVELRAGARPAAAVHLRHALDHVQTGQFVLVERGALDLLALATGDLSLLTAGSRTGEAAVRADALAALLAAERGDLVAARTAVESARALATRLGLLPEADALYWLLAADRTIGSLDGSVVRLG
jgi:hypothetical protein